MSKIFNVFFLNRQQSVN